MKKYQLSELKDAISYLEAETQSEFISIVDDMACVNLVAFDSSGSEVRVRVYDQDSHYKPKVVRTIELPRSKK